MGGRIREQGCGSHESGGGKFEGGSFQASNGASNAVSRQTGVNSDECQILRAELVGVLGGIRVCAAGLGRCTVDTWHTGHIAFIDRPEKRPSLSPSHPSPTLPPACISTPSTTTPLSGHKWRQCPRHRSCSTVTNSLAMCRRHREELHQTRLARHRNTSPL